MKQKFLYFKKLDNSSGLTECTKIVPQILRKKTNSVSFSVFPIIIFFFIHTPTQSKELAHSWYIYFSARLSILLFSHFLYVKMFLIIGFKTFHNVRIFPKQTNKPILFGDIYQYIRILLYLCQYIKISLDI